MRLDADERQTQFLNVDLDIKSPVDPEGLLEAFGKGVADMQAPRRSGRKYWLRVMLMPSPKDPADGIVRFAKLVGRLPPGPRRIWNGAVKEFDIGIHAGVEPPYVEWTLGARAVQAAAECGAEIRITVYSAAFGRGDSASASSGSGRKSKKSSRLAPARVRRG